MVEKVQHSELTGNLCHEPKGADTATNGDVYIANGSGSGSFGKLPLSYVTFVKGNVSSLTPSQIDESLPLDYTELTQETNEVLNSINYNLNITAVNNINKNFKELAIHVLNSDAQINEIKTAVENLETKVNQLIEALRTAGVINV